MEGKGYTIFGCLTFFIGRNIKFLKYTICGLAVLLGLLTSTYGEKRADGGNSDLEINLLRSEGHFLKRNTVGLNRTEFLSHAHVDISNSFKEIIPSLFYSYQSTLLPANFNTHNFGSTALISSPVPQRNSTIFHPEHWPKKDMRARQHSNLIEIGSTNNERENFYLKNTYQPGLINKDYIPLSGSIQGNQNYKMAINTIVPDLEELPDLFSQCGISFGELDVPTAKDFQGETIFGTTDESIFPLDQPGTTQITWTYRDAFGNESSQIQEITITESNGSLGEVDCSLNFKGLYREEEGGISATFNSTGLVEEDGRFYVGGIFNRYEGKGVKNISRFFLDVSLDESFNAETDDQVYVMTKQSDGKILLGGNFTQVNGQAIEGLVRLNSDGSVDDSFNTGTGFNALVRNIALQKDGKILVVGDFDTYNSVPVKAMVRLNTDGSLDSSFVPDIPYFRTALPLGIQEDGKIVFGANSSPNAAESKLFRLNSDGSVDPSLSATIEGCSVWDLTIQRDGKIIIVGPRTFNGTSINGIARINPDGSLDASFNSGEGFGTGLIRTVYSRRDSGVFVGGGFTTYQGQPANRIVAINPDGSLDTRYDFGTGANNNVQDIVQNRDGKLIAIGWFTSFDGEKRSGVVRLHAEFWEEQLPSENTIPSAPTELIASVANSLADISFTLDNDGGSPILNYEYSLDGGAWTTFESSPLMLKSLTNGQEYLIRIRAVNSVGTGEASEVLTFTPIEECFAGEYWTSYPAAENNFWSSVTYGNGKFVAVSRDGQNRVMSSTDGISWTASQATEFNSWNSVTFGNGRFVAIATTGTNRVMSSIDGINWTSGLGPDINNSPWRSVTFGNGRFVAVASGGTNRIMSSTDGINWTIRQAPETNSWWSVTYGNGKFVAVGSLGANRVIVSADGINWTAHQAATEGFWYAVTYGNGKFVAVDFYGNQVMSSTDWMNWAGHQVPESTNWNSVTYGLGRFVAVAQQSLANGLSRVMSSTDGENWTVYKAAEANSWFTVGYGAGKFVALSLDGTNMVMVSDCSIPDAELKKAPTDLVVYPTDGKLEIEFTSPNDVVLPISNYEYSLDGGSTWITMDPAKTSSPISITGLVNDTEYSVAIRAVNSEGPGEASTIIKATPESCFDGQIWVPGNAVEANFWYSMAYGNNKYVAVSAYGQNRVAVSEDGINWTAIAAPQSVWNSVAFGNGKFVAVSYEGQDRVMSSTDGVNWTVHPVNESSWSSVTFGDGKFVAVSYGTNRSMVSEDGINWTFGNTPTADWTSVTFGNGRFVAVALNGANRVMSSTDGVNWTGHTASEANGWESITFGNGKFVAVARTGINRVMVSDNGMDWTSTQGTGFPSSYVTYGNGRFVAVGLNSVKTSLDGDSWIAHKPSNSGYWGAVVYGNAGFVALSRYAGKVMLSKCETSPEDNVPSAPTILEAVAGDTEIEISFTPGDNGGSPISNYEYSLDGGTTWIAFDPEATLSPVTITQLENGKEYSIILRGVNKNGAGAESESVSGIPQRPITTPSIGIGEI